MPSVEWKGGADLAIRLVNPLPAYRPGDTITGTVVRKAHVVSAQATVDIRLCGAATTKLHQQGGSRLNAVFGGHFPFFDAETPGVFQRLHAGPAHVAPDGQPAEWTFSITIPEHPDPRCFPEYTETGSRTITLLSVNSADVASHPLPWSFSYLHIHRGWGPDFDGCIEYYLEATFARQNPSATDTVRLPITFRSKSSAIAPIRNLRLKGHKLEKSVSTLRMMPGMEGAQLSLKQKTLSLLGSSKIPKFSFMLLWAAPSKIQLNHPVPVPLFFRAIPDPQKTSESIRGVLPTATLKEIEITLRATTTVMCPGRFPGTTQCERGDHDYTLGLESLLPRLKQRGPLVIPMSEENTEMMNLGEQLQLRIDCQGVYAFGAIEKRFPGTGLVPTFTTYNIQLSYRLELRAVVEVAGEVVKILGQHRVEVVGPSEEDESRSRVAAGHAPTIRTQEDAIAGGPLPSQDDDEVLPSYQEASRGGESPPEADDLPPSFDMIDRLEVDNLWELRCFMYKDYCFISKSMTIALKNYFDAA
ncbi:hypothetical protein GQ53DRAFT_840596 [Thozetella sp. PMI_491]|nr:hypothetical protein GQ53DRAFT_840596 [Thozetella sp. PMI_491]